MRAQTAKALRRIIRAERLRTIRTWCLALGGIVLLLALFMTIGDGGAGNPNTASSIFAAFEASGLLREVAAPAAFAGAGLVIVGLLAGVMAGRDHER